MKNLAIVSLISLVFAINAFASPITVTDFRGKTLSFAKPPERKLPRPATGILSISKAWSRCSLIWSHQEVPRPRIFSNCGH